MVLPAIASHRAICLILSDMKAARLEALAAARLYFVSDGLGGQEAARSVVTAALAGGAEIVQLRDRELEGGALEATAAVFREAAAAAGALFLVNDDPELALAAGADGVHVGQDDVDVAVARRDAGEGVVVGLSTHSPEQLEAACAADGDSRPDYVSVGPVWETPTKPGRPAAGLDYVRYAAANATLPWFAIGGIDPSNVQEVLDAGARRIVVVRAIRDAPDAAVAARTLREAVVKST
jgi:thiamine-phosphate pyrophosphorylase